MEIPAIGKYKRIKRIHFLIRRKKSKMLKFKNMMTSKLIENQKKPLVKKSSNRTSPKMIKKANKKLKMQQDKKSDEVPLIFYDSESPLSQSPKAVRFAFQVPNHQKKYKTF